MTSKKKLLKKSRLYLIVDQKAAGKKSVFDIVAKVKNTRLKIIQFRDKESTRESILRGAFRLRKILLNTQTLFIINDYLDIAKIVDSDGIHLGQNDTSIEIARRVLGRDKIIGLSCHNLKQAIDAQNRGADYIGIGPIFPTPTKPEYPAIGLGLIKRLKAEINIPFFAIGNINQNNITQVLASRVKRVAICRAILQAENIPLAVKEFSRILH